MEISYNSFRVISGRWCMCRSNVGSKPADDVMKRSRDGVIVAV